MADSQVVINDETFDLVTIPDAKSKMVLKAKDLLLGSLDLQSLVDDLGKLGTFITPPSVTPEGTKSIVVM